MSRITACFARLHAQGRKALIPYVTAGYPALDSTVELMHAMVAAGADIIELGMPFSDPSADGPAIQRANEQALRQGVGLVQVLACVREFRQRDSTTPVVLMGYANPIERYDFLRELGAFAKDAAVAGVDGMLVLDYPPLACEGFAQQLRQHGLDLIFLLAPTSTPERIRQVASMATGYVYCVSIKGVTGAHALDVAEVQARLASLRADIPIPLGVGFGIRDADTAKALAGSADAVIIGSRLIELLADGAPDLGRQAVVTWLEGVRAALDGRA